MRGTERGLKLDSTPEAFAAAMMKCQHGGAFCAEDGFCHFDGDCFAGDKRTDAKAAARVLARIASLEAELRELKAEVTA